jgi:hypothetical protein
VCDNGFTYCSGQCSDTTDNSQHCGACNLKCPPGKQCSGGACT